jgi:hypothetical protein
MPPTDRFVISFAAEPPQEPIPYGRWADTLREHFVAACNDIQSDEEIGEPGEIRWFPDRTYGGRTYIPAVSRTEAGYELFGFVSFAEGGEDNGVGPSGFEGHADFTGDIAENNPDWNLDLNSWEISTWRGEQGRRAEISLVWGVPLVAGGAIVTAELANLAVDQCELVEERFTLIAPDSYRSDFLDVKLWDRGGRELAAESLYDEDEDDGEEDGEDEDDGEGELDGEVESDLDADS